MLCECEEVFMIRRPFFLTTFFIVTKVPTRPLRHFAGTVAGSTINFRKCGGGFPS